MSQGRRALSPREPPTVYPKPARRGMGRRCPSRQHLFASALPPQRWDEDLLRATGANQLLRKRHQLHYLFSERVPVCSSPSGERNDLNHISDALGYEYCSFQL